MVKIEEEFGKLLNCDDLKCNICKHYLSVPPIIYTVSTDIICGRCNKHAYQKNSNPKIHSQTFFEQIAERMTFPCMYENFGCPAILEWKDVKTHEKSCSYRITSCIYKLEEFKESHEVECDWKGPVDQLTKHTKDIHYENFINPPELHLKERLKNCFLFTECLNNAILVTFLYDEGENLYTCTVMSDELRYKGKPLEYHLKIYDEEGVSYSLPTAVLKNLSLKSEILQLTGSKLNLSKIRLIMKPSYIAIDFIKQKCLDVDNYIPESSIDIGNVNHNKLLRCANPDCDRENLTPPVYLSHEMNNICEGCLPKRDSNDRRNFAMEKLLYSTQWRCENLNCSHASSGVSYGIHKEICPFRMKNCYDINCEWNGADLRTHLEETHKFAQLKKPIFLTEGAHFWHFNFDEHLFRLRKHFSFNVDDNSRNCSLKFMLLCLETVKFLYKYEIEITCSDSPHLKLSFQQLVEPEHLPTVYYEYEQNFLILGNVLDFFPLRMNTSKSNLSFSVNISRIDV